MRLDSYAMYTSIALGGVGFVSYCIVTNNLLAHKTNAKLNALNEKISLVYKNQEEIKNNQEKILANQRKFSKNAAGMLVSRVPFQKASSEPQTGSEYSTRKE